LRLQIALSKISNPGQKLFLVSFRVAMGLRPTQLDENPREVYDMVDVEL